MHPVQHRDASEVERDGEEMVERRQIPSSASHRTGTEKERLNRIGLGRVQAYDIAARLAEVWKEEAEAALRRRSGEVKDYFRNILK